MSSFIETHYLEPTALLETYDGYKIISQKPSRSYPREYNRGQSFDPSALTLRELEFKGVYIKDVSVLIDDESPRRENVTYSEVREERWKMLKML